MNVDVIPGLVENAIVSFFLPPILMFIIKQKFDKNVKKLLAALACALVALGVALVQGDFKTDIFTAENAKALTLSTLVTIAMTGQLYDKFWQPVVDKISESSPRLQAMRRGTLR